MQLLDGLENVPSKRIHQNLCQKIPYLKYLFLKCQENLIMRILTDILFIFLETVQYFFVRVGHETTYASSRIIMFHVLIRPTYQNYLQPLQRLQISDSFFIVENLPNLSFFDCELANAVQGITPSSLSAISKPFTQFEAYYVID